jgi:hypothetical protein
MKQQTAWGVTRLGHPKEFEFAFDFAFGFRLSHPKAFAFLFTLTKLQAPSVRPSTSSGRTGLMQRNIY